MRVIENLDEMIQTARGWLTRGSVGFVPIMNGPSLHAGHRALLSTIREHCEITVVCLLRTPLLFDASSDEPDTTHGPEADPCLLADSDIDVLFMPRHEELFPPDFATPIDIIGPMRDPLLNFNNNPGALREFATIFGLLLLIVRPDITFLGQKDAQQAAIIHKIIHDLHIDVSLHIIPTTREKNGLATSSRNTLLTEVERNAATVLYYSLLQCKQHIEQGEHMALSLAQIVRREIANNPYVELLNLAICDPRSLQPYERVMPGTLFALKARVGSYYFIDNILWMPDGNWRL
ncbi:pantoate--beta-alanine ligase [Ktedonospora formicarum]|uniref:pantoate--beta-alanine ligase (AMP-forming) n=1 Tax=Ktedonospora formicarum TaxID=2778364 RepID=A0A8J3HUN2_9CHLR|nr:pantoate--beta-alanine ligase [Ktedonospora formicarum]GHO43596.1 pantothenate synthetase [Ktedonospora formicarum]